MSRRNEATNFNKNRSWGEQSQLLEEGKWGGREEEEAAKEHTIQKGNEDS